jgi:hypothetical protein
MARCAARLKPVGVRGDRQRPQCSNKALPDSALCESCRMEALQRVLAMKQPEVRPWPGVGRTWRTWGHW